MIDAIMRVLVQVLISLRYRVRIVGLNEITRRGTRGILFLANHPALIDPVIVMAWLGQRFAPGALADKDQIDRPFVRWLARRIGVRPIPDMTKYGAVARDEIRDAIKQCAEGLRRGENLLLYPSGRVYRQRLEDIGASRSADRLLDLAPDVRVVLIRTTGLWGSAFSWAAGHEPDVGGVLRKAVGRLLANALFLSPRREVTIELREGDDVPRSADRTTLNRYLEDFYNRDAPPNTYVPHTIWESGGVRSVPEPSPPRTVRDLREVPRQTRDQVRKFLAELTGMARPGDEDHLARDLGLDSIAMAEVVVWVEHNFGMPQADVESLQTVADVMLAAVGQGAGVLAAALKPVPAKWFPDATSTRARIEMPPGDTVTALFCRQARKTPGKLVLADQIAGALSYRRIVTGVLLLKRHIEKLPGERVGIMLPASAGAGVVYLATLFAGKTPVMVNWTLGSRNIRHCLDIVAVERVLTAGRLVSRLESQGADLTGIKDRFVLLERIRKEMSVADKLRALAAARFGWDGLDRAKVPETAAILFTSGSEAAPKCVPLTHANLLSNLADLCSTLTLQSSDRMIGFLPPFHAFGLTVTMLVPLCLGLPAVYHPNPTEGAVLARLIAAYRATMLVGTPTFLGGIARAAEPGQLDSLRLAVTGAEKCPDRVYDELSRRCPNAVVAEGYGITECSPVVTVNDDRAPRRGTIGKPLPSLRHVIVEEDAEQVGRFGKKVPPGQTGMLLVRGPSIFGGYIGSDAPSPFVQFEGDSWYRTGDLVSEDPGGVLTFRGRLKRFVKVAGEMISLPQIESILMEHYQPADEDAPVLAVEAASTQERPEIVLFTTLELDRDSVNRGLRSGGLSALCNIRHVVRVEEIPLLGTGKTDYRRLRESLDPGPAGAD